MLRHVSMIILCLSIFILILITFVLIEQKKMTIAVMFSFVRMVKFVKTLVMDQVNKLNDYLFI